MHAEQSTNGAGLALVLARLPHLTVHYVDLPDRWWVADPSVLTCWVHKGAADEDRDAWIAEAAYAIAEARDAGNILLMSSHESSGHHRHPRLHSVPR